MTERDIQRYGALLRMAHDPAASESERTQARTHLEKAKAKFPGIAAAWGQQQSAAPDYGTTWTHEPQPLRGGKRTLWDAVEEWLDGASRAARTAGNVSRIANGAEVVITQPASVVTCAIVLQPKAVDALLDADANVRKAAIATLTATLTREMMDFFEPE